MGLTVFGKAGAGSSFTHDLLSGVTPAQHHTASTPLASTVVTETRTAAAASGDVAYTGAGFTPTAVIVFAIGADGLDNLSLGLGDDALAEQQIHLRAMDAAHIMGVNTRFISCFDPTGAHGQHAVLNTLDADGITLTWTKAGNGEAVSFVIMYLG